MNKNALRIIAVVLFFVILVCFVFIVINFDAERFEDSRSFGNLFGNDNQSSSTTKLYAGNPRFPEDAQNRIMSFMPDSNFVKYIGRTYLENGTLWFSMSGSGFSFLCDGESATIECLVKNSSSVPYNHRPRVLVLVNGETAADVVLEGESESVTVDLSAISGDAEVQLLKASESMYSTVGVSSITANSKGDICPAPQRQMKIEFIGDSITAGYGLDEENPNAAFSTRTENFSETYAFLAAKELAADCYAVAFSGYGVFTGFSSNGAANDYVIFKHYDSTLSNSTDAPDWDFTGFVPNVVVINLGTNDASYCSTQGSIEAFENEYKRLLYLVRQRNSKAYILCVLGDMNNSLYPSVERAAEAYKAETGDSFVSCSTLSFDMGTYGSAIDGHPNKQSNALAAQTLVSGLRALPLQ